MNAIKKKIHQLKKAVRLLPKSIYRNGLFCGVAATIEHESILKRLKCNTVIDIGANKGQFALMARSCFPNAHIYSFEPLDSVANIYELLFDKDAYSNLYRYAIGSVETYMDLHVSKRNDSSSLLPIGELQTSIFPNTDEIEIQSVKVVPLNNIIHDDNLLSPSLLKIDVQGFEMDVLIGCDELLEQFSYIYIECSYIELYKGQYLAGDIIKYLDQNYFKLMGVYNTYYDQNSIAVQSDFLFYHDILEDK